eukprot:5797-Heterococcus_DN1.PRE.1
MTIPTSLSSFADAFLTMLTAVAVVAAATPAFVVCVPPVAYLYYRTQQVSQQLLSVTVISSTNVSINYAALHILQYNVGLSHMQHALSNKGVSHYRIASVPLKRLDTACKSPLLSHFSQTLDGLPRWLGARLDLLGAAVVLLTALLTVLLRTSSAASSSASSLGGSSAGSAGLALSYALTITRTLSFGVRAATAMENQFNAVERIEEFTVLQQEPQVQLQQQLVVSSSSSGNGSSDGISLHQVHARYAEGLPSVLKGVSLNIARGERIGVCGRTGSGKSCRCCSAATNSAHSNVALVASAESTLNTAAVLLARRQLLICLTRHIHAQTVAKHTAHAVQKQFARFAATLEHYTLALSIIRIAETFQGSIKLGGLDVASIPLQQLRSEVSNTSMLINTLACMHCLHKRRQLVVCCCDLSHACMQHTLTVAAATVSNAAVTLVTVTIDNGYTTGCSPVLWYCKAEHRPNWHSV